MSANEEIRTGIGEAFDELRSEFFPGSVAELLKVSETTNGWDVVLEIENHWFFEDPTHYRNEFLFQLADNSDEITSAMENATHLRIDDNYYVIENRDPTPPKGTGVVWRLLCNKDFKKSGFGSIY